MSSRGRIPQLAAVLFGTLALVVTATGQGLYRLTDDELAGPEQPIQFSHQVHAGTLGIDCQYCHTTVRESRHASIPAVSTCMGCHQWVKQGASPGSAEEIQKLADYFARGESIPWVRIHNLPEHAKFKHNRHVLGGIACQDCHGPVEKMNRVWLVPDTRYNPSSAFLPAAKLEMGWCMDCHEQLAGPRDCAVCHY
jgi:hypothetical protein